MVNFLAVDAASANLTNSNFAPTFSLTNGPFGLRELESILTFPPRNGTSWIVSIRTSDLVAVFVSILVLTFAIDQYLFDSRYLVHIGGATRPDDHPATLDETAALHEKEAFIVESGQKCGKDVKSNLEPQSEHCSACPASTARSRRSWKIPHTLRIVILIAIALSVFDDKKVVEIVSGPYKETPGSPSDEAEAEKELEQSPPISRWGRFVQHPKVQRVRQSTSSLLLLLATVVIVVFRLLLWPWFLMLFILQQCLFYEELNRGAPVPWQSITLKSSLYFVLWTIGGVTLLLKPNRFQGAFWKCSKWVYAVNWCMFWIVFETHFVLGFAIKAAGFYYPPGITTGLVMFFLRPSLVAHIASGVLRDASATVRLVIFFRNKEVLKPLDFGPLGQGRH